MNDTSNRLYQNQVIFITWLLLVCWFHTGFATDLELGKKTYQATCNFCHENGMAGAPRLEDREAWKARIQQPVDILYQHAIEGFRGMPAKGGNSNLSKQEVINATDYMIHMVTQMQLDSESASLAKNNKNTDVHISKNLTTTSSTKTVINYLKGEKDYHQAPSDSDIPNDKYGDDVKLGKKIFTQTHKYASRYAGNELSCSNCHLDAGKKPNSAPMWAAYGMYPSYRSKNDRNNTLEERIQDCFRFSLNGFAPALDAPEIRALIAYFHFLSKGVPVGVELAGRGFPQIIKTGQDPNPDRGNQVYQKNCSICHGKQGEGQKKAEGNYQFPPLWGLDSYNKGAGFFNNQLLAGYIKANMPLGQDWSLSDQEALDVAAYINLQLRPWDPRKGMLKGLFE